PPVGHQLTLKSRRFESKFEDAPGGRAAPSVLLLPWFIMVSCPFRVITCRLKELPLPHARKTILILGQDRGVPRERTADPPLAAGSSGTWCGKTYISTQDTCRPSNAVDFRSARRPESLYEDAAIRGEPPLAKKQLLPT